MFAAVGQAGKLKPFKHYWNQVFADRSNTAQLLGAFMALQDRGYAVAVKKMN